MSTNFMLIHMVDHSNCTMFSGILVTLKTTVTEMVIKRLLTAIIPGPGERSSISQPPFSPSRRFHREKIIHHFPIRIFWGSSFCQPLVRTADDRSICTKQGPSDPRIDSPFDIDSMLILLTYGRSLSHRIHEGGYLDKIRTSRCA